MDYFKSQSTAKKRRRQDSQDIELIRSPLKEKKKKSKKKKDKRNKSVRRTRDEDDRTPLSFITGNTPSDQRADSQNTKSRHESSKNGYSKHSSSDHQLQQMANEIGRKRSSNRPRAMSPDESEDGESPSGSEQDAASQEDYRSSRNLLEKSHIALSGMTHSHSQYEY